MDLRRRPADRRRLDRCSRARNLEVDESLLTGESEPVVKQPGDELLAGSFVVAGHGRARVTKVGADAYAAKLAEEARKFSLVHSDLRAAMDRIVTLVTYVLVPTGIALFISQLLSAASTCDATSPASHDDEPASATGSSAVGGVVAMVPEGLILLTSVAFTVGVVRLARRRTLVKELPAIEVLARVDVICLDKTGTITSGAMNVADVDAARVAVRRRRTSARRSPRWRGPTRTRTRRRRALQARVPGSARAGRPSARSRSRRRASGARRRSTARARGSSARRRW